ncbi:MAG: LLM class flavin-dependent oxidoreductase [Bacteroidota bacterium]
MQHPTIRTEKRLAEIAWFSALCGDDTAYIGYVDEKRRSSFAHCSRIVKTADKLGYKNILLPSSYITGQDTLSFAAAIAPQIKQINLLAAVRCGELHPPMLARTIATLDHILKGRLTINIISSDLPGLKESGELRYQRSEEVIEILKQAWTQERIQFKGELYEFDLPAAPSKPYQQNGGPLLYFGGISNEARELCAKHCDVFLMWPEPENDMAATMQDLSSRAAKYNRKIDFGLRIHVIVRETEAEAKAYAKKLMSKFDAKTAMDLKHRSLDSKSLGVLRQDENRANLADADDFIEPMLWTGIGRARSGCGAAIVGDPDQVLKKMNRYMDMGFRSFILSGYPHLEECAYFAKYVLPFLPNISMPVHQNRIPVNEPVTPLTTAHLQA